MEVIAIAEPLHRRTSLLKDRMERHASSASTSGFLESGKTPLSLLFVEFKIAATVLALFCHHQVWRRTLPLSPLKLAGKELLTEETAAAWLKLRPFTITGAAQNYHGSC
ncbi:uncharacterized protein DS421_10g301330 [Arachis hypogaea]|nr:uncharacterized protein DS421_10g301330 [Arachis hypogaea]